MSKYTESFGKWFNPFDEKMGQASKVEAIQYTFEYQQSKINELLERLRECEESLRYINDEAAPPMHKFTEIELKMVMKSREYFKKYEGH